MSDYTNQVLRVVVAQICQTIGWHSIQSTPLELLVDILHKYLQEISRETYRHTELYGRTEPNLVDVGLAFRNLSINLTDIEEYINYVDCVGCSVDVPKYPIHKESNLNFLKPGSKEVLTRPVHIPEYLPPIYPEKEEGESAEIVKKETGGADVSTIGNSSNSNNIDNIVNLPINNNNENVIFKKPEISENIAKKPKIFIEDEGRPTREISSVMMTSSGFISPAREGKLPDSKAPILPEYKSPPLPPPLATIVQQNLPVGNIDSKFDKKEKKKKSIPSEKEGRKKEKILKESHKRLASHSTESGGGQNQSDKLRPLKKQRNKQKHRGGGVGDHHHQIDSVHIETPGGFQESISEMGTISRSDGITQHHLHHGVQQQQHQMAPIPMDLDVKPSQKLDEIKLSSEPNKEKLNIFKKISTAKKDRDDLSRSPNIFHDTYILSSIPEGTTITPAPPLKHHTPHHSQIQPLSAGAATTSTSTTAAAAGASSLQIDDDPVICVDDEPGFIPDISKNIPVPLPPGTTIKAQTPKKPRKSKQQQQQHLDPNLPINLSNEITASTVVPVNLVKKDIIHNSRLSYPTFPPQKPQKEKKERRKPKVKEQKSKTENLLQPPTTSLNLIPQGSGGGGPSTTASTSSTSSFDEKNLKNFRENAASLFFKKIQGTGKGENILNAATNPYGAPTNFPNVHAPIPMFPFYAFPPRPGLIPNPGLFPALQPMPDNPAFNKFLPMMRFGNFGNINKGPRLTSTYDDEPPPLPPIDTEKSYCNVAPLVPDSMKFQLSPNRLKPKTSGASAGTSGTGASASNSSLATSTILSSVDGATSGAPELSQGTSIKIAKTTLDSPIEISDDENVKSGNEDKDLEGSTEKNLNNSDIIMKDTSHTIGEAGNCGVNNIVGDAVDERNEKNEKRKDKMHKKGKKEKEGKIKKKKDKKDKSKSKDKAEKRKEKEEKKDKDRIKKLKKEKKKDKLRSRAYSGEESKLEGINLDNSQHSTVPKLTLKIGLGNSPQPDSPDGRKLSIKSHSDDMTDSFDDGKIISFDRRESSPELARISPLVTRPPKQKSSSKDKKSDSEDCTVTAGGVSSASATGGAPLTSGGGPGLSSGGPPPPQPPHRGPGRPPKNPSAAHHHHHHHHQHHGSSLSSSSAGGALGAGGSSSAGGGGTGSTHGIGSSAAAAASGGMTNAAASSSVSSSSGTGTAIQNSFSSGTGGNINQTVQTTDAEGNQVWICPACGRVDDGTPMIGCDGCDAWYHWVCVGIQVPPDDNEDWYCRVCIAKKQEAHGADKKRKRKKKNKAN